MGQGWAGLAPARCIAWRRRARGELERVLSCSAEPTAAILMDVCTEVNVNTVFFWVMCCSSALFILHFEVNDARDNEKIQCGIQKVRLSSPRSFHTCLFGFGFWCLAFPKLQCTKYLIHY